MATETEQIAQAGTQTQPDGTQMQAQPGEVTTPETEIFDKERALATIRQQRESEKALKKRLADIEATLKGYQEKEQQSKDAELTEFQKLQKKYAELENAHKEAAETVAALRLRQAFGRAIAGANLKFVTAQAEQDAFELAEMDTVKIEEDGTITGLDAAIKELQKSRPYLFSAEHGSPQGTPKKPLASSASAGRPAPINKPLVSF